ncbi:class I SAM-dependent methyltransferase [Leptospira interrogans]
MATLWTSIMSPRDAVACCRSEPQGIDNLPWVPRHASLPMPSSPAGLIPNAPTPARLLEHVRIDAIVNLPVDDYVTAPCPLRPWGAQGAFGGNGSSNFASVTPWTMERGVMPREPYSSRLKVRLAVSIINDSSRVLDVGCGTGKVLLPLASACASITGMDTDHLVVKQLTTDLASHNNATVQVGNAEQMPFADSSFDTVVCYSTLCVVAKPSTVIAEIARVLKPGGRAVIDFHGARNANTSFWRNYYAPLGIDLKAFSLSDVKRLMQEHGFFVDTIHGGGLTRAAYYLPFFRKLTWLNRINHSGHDPDLDYILSNMWGLKQLAASWYVVARRI